MRHKIPLREAGSRMEDRLPFNCNDTLIGRRGRPYSHGMLATEWVRFIEQFRSGIEYHVLSYATPVVLVMKDGRFIVPPDTYSVTTQRHIRALGVRRSPAVRDGAVAA